MLKVKFKMDRLESLGLSITLASSSAIHHAARVAASVNPTFIVTPEECIFSAVGGFIGGMVLVRNMKANLIDQIAMIIVCALFSFATGPVLANLAADKVVFIGNGLYENIFFGALIGAIGVPVVMIIEAILKSFREKPGPALEFVGKILMLVRKK